MLWPRPFNARTMRMDKKEWPTLEAIGGIVEVGADFLASDMFGASGDLFADIPIVGTLFQVMKAVDSVRDRALSVKLMRFLEPFEEASKNDRDKFRKRLMQDEAETRRVGEILFLVVERLTDLDKAQILGCLFVSYLNEQLSSIELRRMAQAVDISFADDLVSLIESDGDINQSEALWLKSLVPSSLAEPVGATMFDEMGKIYYSMTELGKKLRSAYLFAQSNLLTQPFT